MTDVILWEQSPGFNDIVLHESMLSGFPVQYAGLKLKAATILDLCLVAEVDAPLGTTWKVNKNGVIYAVYLVDIDDPHASPLRIQTSDGLKAVRLKT